MDLNIKLNEKFQWIGENKLGWKIIRSKYIFRNKSSKNHIDEELLSVNQKEGVIRRSELDNKVWNPSEDISGYKLVENGNFIISLRSFEGGLELSKIRGLVSPAYTVLEKIQEVDNDYFWWMMKSNQFIVELNKHVSGIRQGKNIGWDDFSNIYLLKPTYQEQGLISKYLDKKTQKIDSIIKKTETKVELLKEQKTALINQFVTKGLDQNVEKKDSGIDWIGEIPKHWITSRLKYITSRIGDGLHSTPKYVEDSEYHFINGNNLIDGEITISPSTRCVSNDEYKKYLIELNQNCILLSINGTIGNLSLYEGESIILGKSCCYIKLKDSYSRDYFYWFLKSNSVFNYFKNQLTGTTIFNLSLESIRETNILIPPIKEQEEISKLLKKEYKRFTELTKQHYEKIRLLQEYRQSLISSVVTGKIRITEDMI